MLLFTSFCQFIKCNIKESQAQTPEFHRPYVIWKDYKTYFPLKDLLDVANKNRK